MKVLANIEAIALSDYYELYEKYSGIEKEPLFCTEYNQIPRHLKKTKATYGWKRGWKGPSTLPTRGLRNNPPQQLVDGGNLDVKIVEWKSAIELT